MTEIRTDGAKSPWEISGSPASPGQREKQVIVQYKIGKLIFLLYPKETVTSFHVQKPSLERLRDELEKKAPISLCEQKRKHREEYVFLLS